MIPMPAWTDEPRSPARDSVRRLARATGLAAILWGAGMALAWAVGIEPIYGHPAPFYALWWPVGARDMLVAVIALAAWAGGAALTRPLIPPVVPRNASPPWKSLAAVMLLFIGFALLTASIRGVSGAWQAYTRETYEVIGDIGKASSIPAFFRRYNEIHPWLSMHGKVHPPGPAALLWLFSHGTGRSAPALALATLGFGALAIPLAWLWIRRATNAPVARAAALLIGCVPSVVLFGAVSADFLFLPITLATLWLFHEALYRRGHPLWSVAAGVGYACMALMKYSLPAVGAWFAVVGLLMLRRPGGWRVVARTALLMAVASGGVLLLVWGLTGFNYLEGFARAAAQFRLDQRHLDRLAPRYPGWTFRVCFNPLAFFYFAGFPVSLLTLACWIRLLRQARRAARSASPRRLMALTCGETALACLVTACVLNLLYLARGEGERSALYLFPFLVLPAAWILAATRYRARSDAPLATATLLMVAQAILTEVLFYTYW